MSVLGNRTREVMGNIGVAAERTYAFTSTRDPDAAHRPLLLQALAGPEIYSELPEGHGGEGGDVDMHLHPRSAAWMHWHISGWDIGIMIARNNHLADVAAAVADREYDLGSGTGSGRCGS